MLGKLVTIKSFFALGIMSAACLLAKTATGAGFLYPGGGYAE